MSLLPPLAAPATAPAVAAVRDVLRNAGFLLLAYVVPRVLTFAAAVVAARVLGSAVFGAYSTAAVYAVVLSVLATLGMLPLLIRDIARTPERASVILGTALWIKLVAGVLMLGVLVSLGRGVFDFSNQVLAAAALLGVAYGISAVVESFGAYFQAVERMDVWMQANAACGIVWGGAGAVLVIATRSVVWFCLAPVLGQLVALIWLVWRSPREIRVGLDFDVGAVRGMLRSMLPFAAAFLALTVYYKIDVLLLAHWRSDAEVGAYAAAYKFVDILHALVLVAVSAVFPRLARAAQRAPGDGRWAGTRVTELILLGSVPIAGALWLAREPIVISLYGAEYAAAVPVLGLLSLLIPALAINILSGYVLASTGRMVRMAGLYGAGALLNVGLNAILIPSRGAPGAALAMLTSEVLLAGGFLVALRASMAAPGARTVAAAGGAVGLGWLLSFFPDPSGGVLAGALYVAAAGLWYWRADVLSAPEWAALRLAFRPGRGAPASAAGS